MTDLNNLVSAIAGSGDKPPVRFRQGVISTINTDGTANVKVGGSSTTISNLKVAASCCPIPGAACWLVTDGRDWIVMSTLAPSGPAFGQIRQNATQTITSAATAFTTLDFTTRTDVVATGITVTNNGFTIVVPGLYTISAHAALSYNAAGSRFLSINNSGTALGYVATGAMATNDTTRITSTVTVKCAVGDTISASVNQNSGSSLTTINSPGYNQLRAVWVGPAA